MNEMKYSIKFRVWDKKLNKYVMNGIKFSLYGESFFLWGFASTNEDPDRSDFDYVNDVVFEQYTGCNDFNEAEIYVGDIVQYGYRDGLGVVIYDEEDGSFNIDPSEGCVWIDVFRDSRRWYKLEIVGNIHD